MREKNKDIFNLAFKIGGYSLQSNLNNLKDLFFDTLEYFRLDEKERINDITKMHIFGFERNLVNSGHYFAMANSDAKISKYKQSSLPDISSSLKSDDPPNEEFL